MSAFSLSVLILDGVKLGDTQSAVESILSRQELVAARLNSERCGQKTRTRPSQFVRGNAWRLGAVQRNPASCRQLVSVRRFFVAP